MKANKLSSVLCTMGSMVLLLMFSNCGNSSKKKDKACCEEVAQVSETTAVASNIKSISDAEFGDFIKSEGSVLVYFSKETCPKCVPVTELLNEIASENGDKYIIGKVDAANNAESVAHAGVTATPTILIYKNGEEVARFEGAVEKSVVIEALNK